MKPLIEPTLTKNDPCANKGHHRANKLTPIQDHYILFANDMQAEINRHAVNPAINAVRESLGLTDEQLREVIRLALVHQAKP